MNTIIYYIFAVFFSIIPLAILYYIVMKFLSLVHNIGIIIDRQEEMIDLLTEIKDELKNK